MAPERPITRGLIVELLNQGLTRAEVARLLGTSRQNVNHHLKNTGGSVPEAEVRSRGRELRKLLPWKDIRPEHTWESAPYQRAMWHLEYATTGGKGMSDAKLLALRQWYDRLTDFVLEYDPGIAPHKGAKNGGWVYRLREKEDGDLLVRVNEHVAFGRGEKKYWRQLPREDWPSV